MTSSRARHFFAHMAWGLGVLSISRTGEVSFPLLLICALGWVISLMGQDRALLPPAGPINSILGFGVTGYALGYRFWVQRDFITGIIEFLVLIGVVKLIAAKGKRDYFQLYLISFFQVVVAGTLITKAVTFPLFLIYLMTCLWGLLLLTAVPPGQKKGPLFISPFMMSVITIFTFLLTTLALFLFLLLPRAQFGVLAWKGLPEEEPIIGFSDKVLIGQFGRLREDLTRALTFQTSRVETIPGVPLRIRGLAFEIFDGWAWSNPSGERLSLPRTTGGYRTGDGDSCQGEILMEPLGHQVLMVPEGTGKVVIQSRRLLLDQAGNLFMPRIQSKPFQYRVAFDYPPKPEPPPAQVTDRFLTLPRSYSRIRPMVAKTVEGAATPREKADRLETFLQTRYAYTTDLPPVGGDPIEAFLLDTRRGHCEYFATAMAVMARLTGIPSRVVNGFVVREYNPTGGFYLIRQRDAHTWVQCLLPDGWVDFDPTPPADNPSFMVPTLSSWQRWSEVLGFTWRRYVYGYLVEDQRKVYGNIHRGVGAARDLAGQLPRQKMLPLVVAVLGLGISLFLFRRRGTRLPKRRHLHPATAFYRKALKTIEGCGAVRRPSQAPLEYLDLLSVKLPPRAKETFEELTAIYLEWRFGNQFPSRQNFLTVKDLLESLHRSLKAP